MERKTFISYKHSEATGLRDEIIKKLGKGGVYYQGETSESADLSDLKTESIKKVLAEMMYDTSVTIVVVSPNMKQSSWIDWEIEYCLKEISRKGRTSKTNGILGVIQRVKGGYDWIKSTRVNDDGCSSTTYNRSLMHDIIAKNRYNQIPKQYSCSSCKTVKALNGSYISLITQENFLANPQAFIENAYEKSESVDGYELSKTR